MQQSIQYKELFQLQTIHKKGILGSQVGVAVLDTGAYPHQDFNHLLSFQDYVNHRSSFYDDSGHGTHVAGIIGSRQLGAAPDCNLIILKVLNYNGEGKTSHVLQGINWVIEHKKIYNIRIMNISIGTVSKKGNPNQALLDAVNRAWDNGIVVVSAAGNQGPYPQSITTPGISHKIITVGSCDDHLMNHFSRSYSGRGPTGSCIRKPDVVAPGSRIVSCLNRRSGYVEKSGTSMATPFVSGVLALLLSNEPYLSPKQVKLRLYETSLDMGTDKNQQGWGLINPRGLLGV
ncbi:MAG: S8 family peptidase [Lachnospiraceae bacterium]|nr:S8 family peptidase [Lachnospiraceae bacterium]